MAIDPTMLPGVSQGQGLDNTQMNMPPQAGPQTPPSQGQPVDPNMPQPGVMLPASPPPPKEKPKSLIPTDIARLLAESLNSAKMEAAKNLVSWVGDPRGTVTVKDADLLRVWRKRNPSIDPLYEKFINGKSDEEIMYAMYPARRALMRYGRRTYTEQVEFAEKMSKLDQDPRFDFLDKEIKDDDNPDEGYEPPKADFPSKGKYMTEANLEVE